MILALASLAATLQAAAAAEPARYDHLPPKEMRAAIEACGFKQVWVGRDKRKRSVVRVSDTAATDDQLTCAAVVIDKTFYSDEFAPPLAERFAPIRSAIARPRQLDEARARFAREPQRGTPPERQEGETDLALAKRVEQFCGPGSAGAVLEEGGRIVISQGWMQEQMNGPGGIVAMSSTMGCLFQASVIAGFQFGGTAGD